MSRLANRPTAIDRGTAASADRARSICVPEDMRLSAAVRACFLGLARSGDRPARGDLAFRRRHLAGSFGGHRPRTKPARAWMIPISHGMIFGACGLVAGVRRLL